MATNTFLTNPAELARLQAFDGKMLMVREIRDGNGVIQKSEWFLNTEHERARWLEEAETLDEVTNGDADEILDKGTSAEQIAEAIYGSRSGYYVSRVKGAFHYDGDPSRALSNGCIIDQVDGLIIRTSVTGHFLTAINRSTAKAETLTLKGIRRNANLYNDTVAMLTRKNPDPAVAALAEESRKDLYSNLTRLAPAELKALAPVAPKKP